MIQLPHAAGGDFVAHVADDAQAGVDLVLFEDVVGEAGLFEHGGVEGAGEQVDALEGAAVVLEGFEAGAAPVASGGGEDRRAT